MADTYRKCCCMLESLLVPLYAEIETPVMKRDAAKAFGDQCVCSASKDQLILQQRRAGVDFIQRCDGRTTKAEYRPRCAH